MLAQIDWTVLGVGVLTAAASIGGVTVAALVQSRQAEHSWTRQQQDRSREIRREAYLGLLRCIDQVKAGVDGAAAAQLPSSVDSGVVREFLAASVAAEFVAPKATWQRMHPLVATVSGKANLMSLAARGQRMPTGLPELIREFGGDTEDGWARLREDFLTAAREDLAR